MNKIILSGKLLTKPKIEYSKDNKIKFSKNTIVIKNEKDNKTNFIPFFIFEEKAESLCKNYKKNSFISLSGYIINKKNETKIICENFKLFKNKNYNFI